MSRLGLFLPFLAATVLQAVNPPTPCTNREIAFVHSFVGTWRDDQYHRILIPNLPICSDSQLVREKDGKQSAKDQLVLIDLFAGEPIHFSCTNLVCENPIKLADIMDKLQQRLKSRTPSESFEEFKRSHTGQTSTISRSKVSAPRN